MTQIKQTTQRSYKVGKYSYEKPTDEKDLAIPGQGYSVKDLVNKFRMGQPLGIKNNIPVFNGGGFDDEDPTQRPDFDLTDTTEILDQIKANKLARKKQKLEEKIELQKAEAQRIKELETQAASAEAKKAQKTES